MNDNARAARMARRIQEIVASALERLHHKDHRLETITVTDTKITGDLHDATVYYTVRGATPNDEPDVEGAAEALGRFRGSLRKTMGDQLGVRFTPTLTFEFDNIPEASAHMEALLAKARARDEELAKLKENATPAGDPDPYKKRED